MILVSRKIFNEISTSYYRINNSIPKEKEKLFCFEKK